MNSATLHFTQIVNGQKTEVNICEECAQKKGYLSQSDEAFSLHELLTGLFNVSSQSKKMDFNKERLMEPMTSLKCSKCDLSFSEFQRMGKFGCAHCYDAFKARLNSVIRRVHSGNDRHNGKIPKRKGGKLHLQKELTMYREYLKQLIETEKFEEAAVIRDRIKELEKDQGGKNA